MKGEENEMNLDELYLAGKIPARYYNQLNGKTGEENYRRMMIEKQMEKQQMKELEKAIETALNRQIIGEIKKIFDTK